MVIALAGFDKKAIGDVCYASAAARGEALASIPGAVIELSPAAAAVDAAGRDLGRCLAVLCRTTGGPQPARCADCRSSYLGPAGHNRFAVGTVRIPP